MSSINVEDLFFKYNPNSNFSLSINNLSIDSHSHMFIEGPSGCGKTTLLNCLTGLIKPNRGCINILGTDITTLKASELDRFRADHFGIIFQLFNLIPYLNVIENIALPCSFSKTKRDRTLTQAPSIESAAKSLANDLNINDDLWNKNVQQLSIGQQQRVAIARALIGTPDIIIADEPTSALDEINKQTFIEALLNETKKRHSTLLFVSHDTSNKHRFNATYELTTGNHVTI